METTKQQQIDPSKIMQVGTGFWASKTLLTAVNMELFTILSKRELSAREIQLRLGLHSRSLYDFLDALVALGFLNRRGLKETSIYRNASDTDLFLDKNKPSYIGGILEMCNNRLYPFWNDLEEGLKTGLPQNETKNGGRPVFEEIYADPKNFGSSFRPWQVSKWEISWHLQRVLIFLIIKHFAILVDPGGILAHKWRSTIVI